MKKADKLIQYNKTVKAIKDVIKIYNFKLLYGITTYDCPLCKKFAVIEEDFHSGYFQIICCSCPNWTFMHSIPGDYSCGAYCRPNSECISCNTMENYSKKQIAKAIGFWNNVLILFEGDGDIHTKDIVINRMNGSKTYHKNTWLAKAIKECDAKMNDKVLKAFNMQKKYDKPI